MNSLNLSMLASSDDAKLFMEVVNQGIDAHLEAFTGLKHRFVDTPPVGQRLYLDFPEEEIPLLLRRLYELETEDADQWADDIVESQYGIEII